MTLIELSILSKAADWYQGETMNGQNKVYVIDPADSKAKVNVSSSSTERERELPKYLQSSGGGGHRNQGTSRVRKSDRQSGVLLILSYLAGPLSILSTRRGRKSRFWVGLSVFSVVLSSGVICLWREFPHWFTQLTPGGAFMLLAAVMAVISSFSAWTKAVVIAGRYEGPRIRRSPGWIRGPLATGLFGIICPGMGLFIAGRTKQAEAALWMSCITVISLLFLARIEWLWNFNAYAGAFSLMPDALEYIFFGIIAATVLGGLAWVVQALNGVRLAGCASSRRTVSRGNWAAVALLISIIAFSAFSRPVVVAEALGRGAASARHCGMRIIPLHLFLVAIRLDPSRPDYVVNAIELYEDIGEQVTADEIRRDLVNRLEASVPLLEEEGIVISKVGAPQKAMINQANIDVRAVDRPVMKTIPAELLILEWGTNRAKP